MTQLAAPQRYTMRTTETRLISASFDDVLESGEAFTGTPTASDSPSDLTIASIAFSTTEKTILGKDVAAGRVVSFTATGGTADTDYTVTIRCGTDATPAQTVEGDIFIRVI